MFSEVSSEGQKGENSTKRAARIFKKLMDYAIFVDELWMQWEDDGAK